MNLAAPRITAPLRNLGIHGSHTGDGRIGVAGMNSDMICFAMNIKPSYRGRDDNKGDKYYIAY
jgi:hypothetical protein